MAVSKKQKLRNLNKVIEKQELHSRNPHRIPYNFAELCDAVPELKNFIFINNFKKESLDFANPEAVKMLNKALLKFFYDVQDWDIPSGYLCPPIPGRADYLHYVADLLAEFNEGVIPLGAKIRVLDVGVGANAVYPILGLKAYEWQFVGSDIDSTALENVEALKVKNPALEKHVETRTQKNSENIFEGIILPDEQFDLTICNPPFHSSLEEATQGSLRKVRNLNARKIKTPILNFGGQNTELWCKGGELTFIKKMVEESLKFSKNCFWFTTLVSKSEHLPGIYKALDFVKPTLVKTIEMRQGQKISRIVAWSFKNEEEIKAWKNNR